MERTFILTHYAIEAASLHRTHFCHTVVVWLNQLLLLCVQGWCYDGVLEDSSRLGNVRCQLLWHQKQERQWTVARRWRPRTKHLRERGQVCTALHLSCNICTVEFSLLEMTFESRHKGCNSFFLSSPVVDDETGGCWVRQVGVKWNRWVLSETGGC